MLSLKTLVIGGTGVLLATPLFLSGASLAKALENMNSSNFTIQMGNFNMTSGTKSSSSYTLTDTVGELAPGEFNSSGYTVLAGFQYIYALPEFSFAIIDPQVDLGQLDPNVFATDTNQLVISTRSAGYTILARAQHVLRTSGSAEIPFTTCDSTCTTTTAQPWTDPQNIGLGFNVSGVHAAADFVTASYFRPFANQEALETAQTIASHGSLVTGDVLTVTYQLSVPQSQAAGTYITVVDYTAVPNY